MTKEVLELTPDGKVRVVEKKRSKYGAKRQCYNGVWFDSKAELRRWLDLQRLERAGKVRYLGRQYAYRLDVNGILITTYVADFLYQEAPSWEWMIEDVKGGTVTQTPEFLIKKKLMKAIHDIDIKLTGKGVK